jgi:hypothetical protein
LELKTRRVVSSVDYLWTYREPALSLSAAM